MRKSTLLALGIVLLGGIVAVALVMLSPEPVRRPPPVLTPLVQTVPADVRTGTLRVTGSGTVRPRAQVSLAPQVSGKVVYVSPALVSGGRVRRGQELVRIEQADYENALRQAQADVAQQQVGLMQAEEEVDLARAEYERFQAREAQRQQMRSYAGIDANDYAARLRDTVNGPATTTPGSDAEGPSRLVLREPQQEAARAALNRAEAMLEDAQLALARTRLRAPFDGYVRSEAIDEGQFVATGQALAEIYAADEVEVIVPLSTDEAALIPQLWEKRADRDDLRIPAYVTMTYGGQDYQWTGYVDRAEAALDATSRTIDIVVRVPRPFAGGTPVEPPGEVDLLTRQAPPLLVGQYTTVAIEGTPLERYLAIPRQALRVDDEVWTVRNDSLLHIIPVQVIQKVGDEVFILAEVDETAAIVVSDLPAATEGMRVRRAEASQ